jgi:hypothetical protein
MRKEAIDLVTREWGGGRGLNSLEGVGRSLNDQPTGVVELLASEEEGYSK